MPMPADALRAEAGFTLIELVVFIAVIGIALGGVLLAVNQASSRSADPLIQIRAAELGQAYLDEILPKKYDQHTGNDGQTPRCGSSDPGSQPCSATLGPESGETRARYDDVDDYNGLSDDPPLDAEGNARPGYAGYRADVSVAYAGSELPNLGNGDAKRITVTITTPQGESFAFAAYRTNF